MNADPADSAKNRAVYHLADDIHENHMRILGAASAEKVSFDELVDRYDDRYPALLFGELAMEIAGIEAPPLTASAADRARAISEAMQRITTTPRLIEAVTGVPYSSPDTSALSPVSRKLMAAHEMIIQSGCLDREQLGDDYEGLLIRALFSFEKSTQSKRWLQFAKPNTSESTVELKLQVTTQHFSTESFIQTGIDPGEVWIRGYKVLAVTSEVGSLPIVPRALAGKLMQFDSPLIVGAPLNSSYGFSTDGGVLFKQGLAYPQSYRVSMPVNLKQAWLGNEDNYPLF